MSDPTGHPEGADISVAIRHGLDLVNEGDYRRAEQVFGDVLRSDPASRDALMYLGSCRNAIGNYAGAITCFESLLQLEPENAHALTYLGAAQQHLGRHINAESLYRRALQLKPDLPDALCNLGRLLLANGDFAEARICLDAAMRSQPGHQVALAGLALLDERAGQPGAGLARLLPLVERGVADADVVITAARLCRSAGDFESSYRMLLALLEHPDLPAENDLQGRFALARSCDGLGRYDEAWSYLDQANRQKAARYDAAAVENAVNRVIGFFSKDQIPALPSSTVDSERPVFLIGLPRSGKSLLESLLSKHPAIAARGEMTRLGEISMRLGHGGLAYPEVLAITRPSQLDCFSAEYLDACGQAGQSETRTIDTLPGNFLHVGLIRLLLPGARIIWCRRQLLDTALYCLFKNFSGESLAFSFSQADIVHYFTHFCRLMNHWQTVCADRMYIVDYEMLVHDAERVLRQTSKFLAVESWHWPDTSELHDREIGHHQHYRQWIDTLTCGLGDQAG